MTNFSPREIVSELDRYIIGQKDAKRAVAVAVHLWPSSVEAPTDGFQQKLAPGEWLAVRRMAGSEMNPADSSHRVCAPSRLA